MARRKNHDYGTRIPRFEMEALAQILLPEIQRFYESAEGQAVLKNGRLNKTPKTPKTTKTSTGGARIGRIRSRRFLCVFSQLFIQKEKSERISHLEDTVRIILIWSEWRDSNARPRHPKCRVLPTALHPDIIFFSINLNVKGNYQLWSNLWSRGKIPHYFSNIIN